METPPAVRFVPIQQISEGAQPSIELLVGVYIAIYGGLQINFDDIDDRQLIA